MSLLESFSLPPDAHDRRNGAPTGPAVGTKREGGSPTGYGLRAGADLSVRAYRGTRRSPMADHVYRVTEIVGSWSIGSDKAIRKALERAKQTSRHLEWFEVVNVRGHIEDGAIGHFQVTVKVGFRLDDAE